MTNSKALITFIGGLFITQTVISQQGLLWRVTGHGHTGYVFGTMHTSDSIANSMDSTVYNAMHRCQTVLLEGDLSKLPDPQKMAELMMLPEGDLSSLYSPEEMREIDLYLEDKLPPMGQLLKNNLYPVFVLFMVQQMEELERVSTDQESMLNEAMDVRFQHLADSCGIATYGIESWDEQMASVASIPLDVQVKLLLESARGKQFSHVITNDIVMHYYQQNLTAMSRIMDENDALQNAFFDAVLYSRNDRFMERALPYFESGPTFMAVGALHLAGDRGVLTMFRKLGYQVENVPFTFLNYHSKP
ncbi:MAG: hypothetical protein RLZZ262_2570 [Bacteroidota bacterium]|jgi:uncharacterized protein